jgi:hypothetical protein
VISSTEGPQTTKESLSGRLRAAGADRTIHVRKAPIMSTSPRIAAKLLAVTVAAAATVGIGLAAAAPAIAKPSGPGVSGPASPTGSAAAIMRRPVNPFKQAFERFENAFDSRFHIPDPDDPVPLPAK